MPESRVTMTAHERIANVWTGQPRHALAIERQSARSDSLRYCYALSSMTTERYLRLVGGSKRIGETRLRVLP